MLIKIITLQPDSSITRPRSNNNFHLTQQQQHDVGLLFGLDLTAATFFSLSGNELTDFCYLIVRSFNHCQACPSERPHEMLNLARVRHVFPLTHNRSSSSSVQRVEMWTLLFSSTKLLREFQLFCVALFGGQLWKLARKRNEILQANSSMVARLIMLACSTFNNFL